VEFKLLQNFPNPFNPVTTIRFVLAKQTDVELTVFDASGKKVRTLINGSMKAGEQSIQFNASDLASGVYFYRVKAGNYSETKKMLLIK